MASMCSLQVAILLSEPGRDFEGEFVLRKAAAAIAARGGYAETGEAVALL